MYLRFNVESQHLTRTDRSIVVARSENYLKAKFDFSPDWDGVTKTGVFTNNGRVYNVILDNDECFVPTEVIRKGCFTVSVFGGDLITADVVTIRVEPSGYEIGGSPEPPTPEVYEQVLGMFDKFRGGEAGQVLSKSSNEDLEFEWVDQGGGGGGTAPRWGNITGTLSNQTDLQAALDAKENAADAFDGDYNNLTNKPTLFSGDYNDLTNKPTLFSGDYDDLSNKPTLFSGNYNDLTNKPDIPTVEANPTLSGQEPTLNGISINGDNFIVPSGGTPWIDERDITTRQLIVDEDIELEDITSEGDVFLYDNENLAVMTDIAETTSKDVTYKIKDGLVYINGTASGALHIYPTMVLPSWLKGCTLTAFVEVVSGTKTGTITFKTPYTYRKSDGTESQASMNTNATAKATVTSMNVNTTTVEFSVPAGAGGTNLVLKPYIAVKSSDYNSMSHELKPATKEAVGTTLSNKSGILMSMTADFTAHVKSKKRLPNLFGKRLVVCGDSVAYGAQGNPFGFTIAQKQNLSYENHAESGASISIYTPYKYIAGQIANLTGDYDFILCDGGYNDRAHQVALGELTTGFSAELDETTLLGATESLCKSLITKYPTAKKLFVLVHKVANTSYVVDSGQQTYFDAIITALKKWNIPYIDLREYPLCAYNETYANTYFNPTDFASNGGVHPNNAGYAIGYINQITAKMESI